MRREVEWVNRFLDREWLRPLADNTLRSYALDLLHFTRWWDSVNHTDAINQAALSASVLLDYLRFQAGHLPKPAAATINPRVGVVGRALRNGFPDVPSPFAPGFHRFYWRRSPLGDGSPRPALSRLVVKPGAGRGWTAQRSDARSTSCRGRLVMDRACTIFVIGLPWKLWSGGIGPVKTWSAACPLCRLTWDTFTWPIPTGI
jgi:hypothetical protein